MFAQHNDDDDSNTWSGFVESHRIGDRRPQISAEIVESFTLADDHDADHRSETIGSRQQLWLNADMTSL
jgi:hypothetical protein